MTKLQTKTTGTRSLSLITMITLYHITLHEGEPGVKQEPFRLFKLVLSDFVRVRGADF